MATEIHVSHDVSPGASSSHGSTAPSASRVRRVESYWHAVIDRGYRLWPCVMLVIAAFIGGSPPAVAGEADAAKAKATVQECASHHVVVIAIKPEITAGQFKPQVERLKLREVIGARTSSDDIATAITVSIDRKKLEALRARWSALKDSTKSFDEWLDGQRTRLAQQVEKDIDAAIKAAQDALPAQIDQLCSSLADGMNKAFAVDATITATYRYACDDFDPGKPGWSAAKLSLPRQEVVTVQVPVGFAIEIPLRIDGIDLGTLPVVSRVEVNASAQLTGFHGSPRSWRPTFQDPRVTSSFKVNARWAIQWKATETQRVRIAGGLSRLGGNISITDEWIPVEMKAEKQVHAAR